MLPILTRVVADYTYGVSASINPTQTVTPVLIVLIVVSYLIPLALLGLLIVGMWRTFEKAGKPGSAIFVPFYGLWLLAKISGKPGWWMYLLLIPFVDLVILLLICMGIARNFGKSGTFGFFAVFLFPIVGYSILGFGSATYQGAGQPMPSAAPMPPTPPVA